MSGADDFRDYLNQQAQGAQAEHRLQDLMADPDRIAADAAEAVRAMTSATIGEIVEEVELIEDGIEGGTPGLVDMVVQAKNLRKQITAETISVADAKAALLKLREHHTATAKTLPLLKQRYDSVLAAAKDPGARRDELLAKYPGLRG